MFKIFEDKTVDFIKTHSKAVIATVDENSVPSTSTIFYAMNKHGEMHFITKSETVKYQNLKNNGNAALTIVDNEKPVAVNLTGTVREVTDPKLRDDMLQEIFKISYGELHDYAPIIKLHKGSFTVMNFVPSKGKMTDFTDPMGKAKENLKKF